MLCASAERTRTYGARACCGSYRMAIAESFVPSAAFGCAPLKNFRQVIARPLAHE